MERKQMSHLIDIQDPHVPLEDSMAKEFQSLSLLSPAPACSIYRVPDRLRHLKQKAYTPKVVSIGPLRHGGSEAFKATEEHKMRYLRDFIGRTGKTLKFFIDVVKEKEAKIRDCYAETIDFTSEKLVKIILVDTAFILELPFFILEHLFNSYKTDVLLQNDGTTLTINMLTVGFFKSRMESPGIEERWEEILYGDFKIEHFVDLLRHVQFKPDDAETATRRNMKLRTLTTPSATELHEAGVLFKVRNDSKNLFDIKFEKGKLETPSFILSDETEYSIRNSFAFEQCHCSDQNYINDYVILIRCLVETRSDIDLLVKLGIIENRLSNGRDASLLLNKLAEGAILDQENFYFATLFEDLNKYYNTLWHKWKAHLKQRYFRTPWEAAAFLLILTIVQTVCSVAAVFLAL
ncbi:putative UPF0481 protein At3g02645 [Corylus avellana]|uniref:putative UPF0481 protein At3g02645 n=1 Tax=Corylus avellana TaxID=13451 RepID=UPI001E210039|nr:putative UPF0481 protein At3g02645 [Corylus avellana]